MRCPMWYCDVGDKAANDEIKGDRGVGKSIRLQKVKRISASPTRSYSPPGLRGSTRLGELNPFLYAGRDREVDAPG